MRLDEGLDLGQSLQHQQPLRPGREPRVPDLVTEAGQHLVHLQVVTGQDKHVLQQHSLTWPGSMLSPAAWPQMSFSAGRMSRVGSVNLKYGRRF